MSSRFFRDCGFLIVMLIVIIILVRLMVVMGMFVMMDCNSKVAEQQQNAIQLCAKLNMYLFDWVEGDCTVEPKSITCYNQITKETRIIR